MKTQIITVFAAMALLIGACGKDKPLTDAQKQQVKDTVTSISGLSSTYQRGSDKKAGRHARQSSNSIFPFLRAEKHNHAHGEGTELHELQELTSECQFEGGNVTRMATFVTPGKKEAVKFAMSGPNCPLDLKITGNVEIGQDSMNGDLHIVYKAKEGKFTEVAGVDSIDAKVTFEITSESLEMSVDGTLHHVKYGDIKVELTAEGTKSGVSAELVAQYKDFTARLGYEVDKNGKMTYYVQGREVSEQEFRDVVMALPGVDQSTQENPDAPSSTSSTKTSYKLTENDCSTGEQSFSSEEALCQGLKSHSLNKGCAINLRKSLYQSKECARTSGLFVETP